MTRFIRKVRGARGKGKIQQKMAKYTEKLGREKLGWQKVGGAKRCHCISSVTLIEMNMHLNLVYYEKKKLKKF